MGRRRANPGPTLAHFERTGAQDCANAITSDDFTEYLRAHPTKTPTEVVDAVWRQYEAEGLKDEWLAQNRDDVEDLDPQACYRWWRDGWKAQARAYVAQWQREIARGED